MTIGWEWEDSGNQLTEQHTITQRESTQNIRGELREAKDKDKGRAGETRASAAAITTQALLLCKCNVASSCCQPKHEYIV